MLVICCNSAKKHYSATYSGFLRSFNYYNFNKLLIYKNYEQLMNQLIKFSRNPRHIPKAFFQNGHGNIW